MLKLDGMDVKALRLMRQNIDQIIARKQQEERVALRARFDDLAAKSGMALDEVFGRPAARKGRSQRLRDRKTGVIWAGRGRLSKNFDRNRADPM